MRVIASIIWVAVLTGAQPDVRLPTFIDVASGSPFAYVTKNGLRDRKYFPQPMCGGVALLDFDNDGKLDVYLTNGAQLPGNRKVDPGFHHALLRNTGDSRLRT
ncbi:MAG: hypothetical protein WKF37_09790 [Bryobacteraceae bacterium]